MLKVILFYGVMTHVMMLYLWIGFGVNPLNSVLYNYSATVIFIIAHRITFGDDKHGKQIVQNSSKQNDS